MGRNLRLSALAALILLGWGAGVSLAGSGDADGTYTVTVTKVELSTDGSNFITAFSGSSAINIASATAGAQAAGLVSGAAIPPGNYSTIRVTLGSTLLIKGFITISGNANYTNGGTDSNGFAVNIGDANPPSSGYTISTFTIPAANRVNTFTPPSFTVKEGSAATTCSITFNTAGVITNSGGTPTIGPPDVSVSVS
ncbi:MAG: hypothetical protein HYZ93_05075 [Candidatus Omnitrophica bacterium]|nr:hypothetical protein [Candidatus Omnitrophota bacterium]